MALLLGGALLVGAYYYVRLDEEIRRRVEDKFASKYPGLTVTVRAARLVHGRGIEVRGLSIVDPGIPGARAELAYFDEMLLACDTSLEELARGEPKFSHILLRRPVMRATRMADGGWSAARLFPIPKFGANTPITIEGGAVELVEPRKNPHGSYTVRDINLTVNHRPSPGGNELLTIIEGALAGDHLQRIELKAAISPGAKMWSVSGVVAGLGIAPELFSIVPQEILQSANWLGSMRGQASASFQVSYDSAQASPLKFEVDAELSGGRIDDARLPYPLTEVAAKIHADNSGYSITECTARKGQTTLRLSCQGQGYSRAAPLMIEAETRNLTVDQQWVELLPEKLRTLWFKFLPAGEIDARVRLSYDGQRWKPEAVTVQCLNVAFTFYKFPYRMEHATGRLSMQNDKLTVSMAAFAGSSRIEISGEFLHPGPDFTGWLECRGSDITIDRTLVAALSEKQREVLTSLNPVGTFNIGVLVRRDDPRQAVMDQRLVATLNRCSIKFDRFPYPIGNISGRLDMINGQWTFSDLAGSNDAGQITCAGEFTSGPEGGALRMVLRGQDVLLEEELRDALTPAMQQLWTNMKPRGQVNFGAEVRYATSDKKLGLVLHVEPVGETASIEPACFPIRLDKVQGSFDYRDGRVDFTKLRAVHDRITVNSGGRCEFQPDGGWQVYFTDLTADRMRWERDLIEALPSRLRRAVGELNPTGPIGMRGSIMLAGSTRPNTQTSAQWDLSFDMQRGSLTTGIKLDNVYGGLRLIGGCNERGLASRGELAIESLTYRDIQFTDIRGPIWIDDEKVLLGSDADRLATGRAVRKVTARVYGGVALGDCSVAIKPNQPARFGVTASLQDADLARFAKETLPGRQKFSGKVYATIDMGGTSAGSHTLRGKGDIRLRDADIYELPVMVALLKILSIREPDSVAFTTSDIDYRLEGQHVYFDKINFSGDAISLLGSGELNLDSTIKLTFHSLVGRPEFQLPVVKTLLGEASKTMLLIHVEGSLSNPKTRTEALPVLNQALQSLQMENAPTRSAAPLPTAPPPTTPLPPVSRNPAPAGAASPRR